MTPSDWSNKIWRAIYEWFTTARVALIISAIAAVVSFRSLHIAELSYDLSVARDQRELMDKKPAIDVQMRPAGVSTLSVTISIINRADVSITPLDIVAVPSIEAGELYFASDRQSIDKLNSALSLNPMGTIAPKGNAAMKVTLAGVTDGKPEQFRPGLELEFSVRIRFADQQDTVEQFNILRRILPAAGSPPPRPTMEMILTAIMEAKRTRENQQLFFYAEIGLTLAGVLILNAWLWRRLPKISSKTQRSPAPDTHSDSSAGESGSG
jgi:hypothetical protein